LHALAQFLNKASMKQRFVKLTFLILIFLGTFFTGFANREESIPVKDSQLIKLTTIAEKIVDIAIFHDSVTVLLNQADRLAESEQNIHQTVNVLILRGINEYYSGDFEGAIGYYYQALDLAEQFHDSVCLASANRNLGIVYDELEDYNEAINYYQKSLAISRSIRDSVQIGKSFQNIAISYQNKKELSKAKEYVGEASLIASSLKDTTMIIHLTNILGTIAYYQEKLDESLEYYLKALELYRQTNNRTGITYVYNNIGLVYLDKSEFKKSLEYFNQALSMANDLKMFDFTANIYSNLSVYYKDIKDFKNAYYYYDKYNMVKDSLAGDKKNKIIRQIQAKYQLGQKTRELEELRTKNQKQLNTIDNVRSTQLILIGLTTLAVILMIVTIYLLIKEKKLAAELIIKSDELNELNLSKDRFFSIIAHDLKNPFNVLVSYTSLLKTDMEMFTKDELKQIIADLNKASENGYNLLQNLLLWTRSQTNRIHIYKSNFDLYVILRDVKALVELNLMAKNQKLIIENNTEMNVYADKEMIATVVRNLVFNAIKFSSKGSEILLKVTGLAKEVKVDVVDSGTGMPKETIDQLFRIDKNTSKQGTDGESGTGLGLIICREFVTKNNGAIWVESELGKGSVFSFTIPLQSRKKPDTHSLEVKSN
jgi:signal transduction histidine kinase